MTPPHRAAKRSAGLLMYRRPNASLEVLLVHPGGPFWARKHIGAWSIPKGEYRDPEDALTAAKREFAEETGFAVTAPFLPLGTLKQPSGKEVTVWAFEGDCDPTRLVSVSLSIEWPPKSAKTISFPEVDRAAWFGIPEAVEVAHKGQRPFFEILARTLRETNQG